jgi:hypothetical protein
MGKNSQFQSRLSSRTPILPREALSDATLFLVTVAVLALAASNVHSGVLNTPLTATFDGTWLYLVTGSVQQGGTDGQPAWDANMWVRVRRHFCLRMGPSSIYHSRAAPQPRSHRPQDSTFAVVQRVYFRDSLWLDPPEPLERSAHRHSH